MAKPLSREQFIRNLRDSGLFSPEETDAVLHAQRDYAEADGDAIAQLLIIAGKVTPFQAAAVRERRFEELAIGNYQVLDRLGAGGMGTVYKARHRRMKRVVAIKVLSRKVAESEKFLQRFQREVEAVARLSHPNIVTAHDADESDMGHYLVMEYVDGRDLDTEVRERGPLPIREAVDCIIQAGRALAYAHGQGIIHRDIKPANLLRDVHGIVKVADLGLARFNDSLDRSPNGPSALTQAGTIMGTVDFMSPEQALGLTDIDHRTDIYSLGCTLHFLLIGRPPFEGPTIMAVLLNHREAAIPSLCAIRQDVPAALDAVLQRMMAKKPQERYGDMAEVVRALEAVALVPCPSKPAAARAAVPSATVELVPSGQVTGTNEAASQTAEPGEVPVKGGTALLVEPSRPQAVIIRGYLRDLGFTDITTARSGREALEIAGKGAPGTVICTMHLPDMTGVQLAQALRAEKALSATGFVLITSQTDADEANLSSQAAGAVRLPKPFDRDQLARALAAATVPNQAPGAPAPGRLRVLVVDDSAVARTHIRMVLAGLGVREFVEAADGAEAMAVLEKEAVDLVVTDYNMPRLDGRALIDYIRHRSAIRSIPVIVVTTETDSAKLDAVRRLGVSAICEKTFAPAVVRGVLERLV
jgi:serine/threonine protein kinase/CheY-like chemotaxis protein